MPKIHIKTYGCSFNKLDSQIMSGILKNNAFSITNSESESDVVLINSCTVKNLSESKLFSDIRKYKKEGKKIVVSGCIGQAEESYLNTKLKDISVIGTNDLDIISDVVIQTLNGNSIHKISKLNNKKENEIKRAKKEKIRLEFPKTKKNQITQIIPISEGCLNTCFFCKTKQARGNLFSYSIDAIKKAFIGAIENGAKEIYLTSQDTGCYGFDIKTNLPELLLSLLEVPGDYKIRIGMGNPNHFKKIIDEILQIMENDKRVYKFLHVPLQSGSNRILNEMRRMYSLKDYNQIILKARLQIPSITIANDIIVAYPTETVDEFQETIKNLKQSRTNVLNYSRFWLRPNTPAEKMYSSKDFIKGDESKRRSKELREEFMKIALSNNKKWIGWEGEVLITKEGKTNTNTFVGRNNYYKPIILKKKKGIKIGDKIKVKITDVTWYDFRGEIV